MCEPQLHLVENRGRATVFRTQVIHHPNLRSVIPPAVACCSVPLAQMAIVPSKIGGFGIMKSIVYIPMAFRSEPNLLHHIGLCVSSWNLKELVVLTNNNIRIALTLYVVVFDVFLRPMATLS